MKCYSVLTWAPGPTEWRCFDGGCSVKCDFWVLPPSFAATTSPLVSSKSHSAPAHRVLICTSRNTFSWVFSTFVCVPMKPEGQRSNRSPSGPSAMQGWQWKIPYRAVSFSSDLSQVQVCGELTRSPQALRFLWPYSVRRSGTADHPVFVGISNIKSRLVAGLQAYIVTGSAFPRLSKSVLPRASWLPAVYFSQVLCVSRTFAIPT